VQVLLQIRSDATFKQGLRFSDPIAVVFPPFHPGPIRLSFPALPGPFGGDKAILRIPGPDLDVVGEVTGFAAEVAAGTSPSGTLTICTNTILTKEHTGSIVIADDNVVLNCNGFGVRGSGSGIGIQLVERQGVTVENCQVTNFEAGLGLRASRGNFFRGNHVFANADNGVDLGGSNDNTFVSNTVMNNRDGIQLRESRLNIFDQNTVTMNRNNGFDIIGSPDNTFVQNTVAENENHGFDLDNSNTNLFRLNRVHGNRDTGVNLDSSSSNLFVGNMSNENGDKGFEVEQASRNNTFIRNTAHGNATVDFRENSHPNFFQGNNFGSTFGIRSAEQF